MIYLTVLFFFMWCFVGGQLAYYRFQPLLDHGRLAQAFILLAICGPFVWICAALAYVLEMFKPRPPAALLPEFEVCADCPHRRISHSLVIGSSDPARVGEASGSCKIPGCPCQGFVRRKT